VGEDNEEMSLSLDQLAREGARRMIAAALRAEADVLRSRARPLRTNQAMPVVVHLVAEPLDVPVTVGRARSRFVRRG
jgi:hypothetical protein